MKLLKVLLTLLFISGGFFTGQAQILKKLKKKIEKGVENTVIDKTNENVQHEAGKVMDQMMNGELMKQNPMMGQGEMADIGEVADSYRFSYVYTLEMRNENSNETATMEMYLEPNARYWGMKMQQAGQMTMVHDADRNLMVMYMDQNGQKMVMALKTDLSEIAAQDADPADFAVREIEGKEILGYDCQGFEVETPDYLVTVYNTFDTEVTMANVFGANEELPSDFDPKWIQKDGKYGLMMELHMKDKSGQSDDVSMRCTDLREQSLNLNKSEYEAMQMPGGQNKQ